MDTRAAVPVVPVANPTPFPAPPRRRTLLFPPGLASPPVLALVWLAPQALLLWLNLDAWSLASGDASPSETHAAHAIFLAELLLFTAGSAVLGWHLLKQRPLSHLAGAGLLLAASIYLAIVFTNASTAIPAALRDWILPPDQWLLKQFALVMPGALYGAFRAICPDDEDDPAGSIGVTALAIFGSFGVCFMGLMAISSSGGDPLAGYLFLPIYLAASTLLAAVILRACASIYVACRRKSPAALVVFTAFVAIGLPLAGLALNARIPFPFDFQIPAIYALAVANGLALCLPNFAHPVARRAVWLLQCAFLPFSLYFFAVFLPFLPFMPIGLLVLGLGVLIAVPSALFILHSYRVLDGWRMEHRDSARWIPAALGIAAFAAGPAVLTSRILLDRHALHGALDYLTYPDYSRAGTFEGDRSAVQSALLRMRDFKQGHYLPFYSEFYNALAFDRLVLPQAKLEETWRAFSGMPLPKAPPKEMAAGILSRSRPRNAQEVLSGPVGARPSVHAITSFLTTSATTENGRVRALAKIGIHNPTAGVTEYETTLQIPDGVLVTGMWLTIGTERVPARLFEQRAAEWVYQKITEVRPVPRDPAILRFTGPNAADLRVYPVEPQSDRLVEIEFSYPGNLSPSIAIDGRPLELPAADGRGALRSPDGTSAWIPAAAMAEIPAVVRELQPHLIIDVSRESALREPDSLRASLDRALSAFPDARTARVSFVNFGVREFRDGAPIPIADLRALAPEDLLREAGPFDGGFLQARAIKFALSRSTDPGRIARWSPMIVVLRGSDTPPVHADAENLAAFARLAPDIDGYWIASHGALLQWTPFPGRAEETPASDSLRIFRLGGSLAAAPANAEEFFVQSPAGGSLEAWDPRAREFRPIPTEDIAGLSDAAAPWLLAIRRILEPSHDALARLVNTAKDANVLVPGTAFMVVENSSQWKMLERTEKKALGGHDAMTLSEKPAEAVPEPSTIILLVLAGAAIAGWKWRQHRITLSRAADSAS